MGDVVKFSGKKPASSTEPAEEEIHVMVCGQCDSVDFFLAVDYRVFCADCLHPVAAHWTPEESNTVA